MPSPVDDPTLVARLRPKFTISDGCWQWTAALDSYGYPQIWCNHRVQYAHRVMYELFIGPIPEGLQLDHLCRNPKCVRPDHLEPVTMAENIARGWATGEHVRWQRKKTECPQGHPYDEANTYICKTGRRHCRACARAYYHRTKGAKNA
jgi:hypothetical protein